MWQRGEGEREEGRYWAGHIYKDCSGEKKGTVSPGGKNIRQKKGTEIASG